MLVTRTGGFPIGFRQGWTEWFKDIDGMIAWAKANNISVIDLGGDALNHLEKVTGAGIRVGSVDLLDWQGLISENPEDRATSLAKNKTFIESCAKYGVTNYFAVMIPKDSSKPRAENFGYMVESLNELAKILEPNNGHLVIEGWPGAGALSCTPEGYRACLQQTPDCIGINYDPSHLIRMGIDPIRFVKEFAPRVYHVHGKDCQTYPDNVYEYGIEQPTTFGKNHDFGTMTWRYTIPGAGETNWPEALAVLAEAGYKGAVSIELEDENYNGTEAGEKDGIVSGGAFLAAS